MYKNPERSVDKQRKNNESDYSYNELDLCEIFEDKEKQERVIREYYEQLEDYLE